LLTINPVRIAVSILLLLFFCIPCTVKGQQSKATPFSQVQKPVCEVLAGYSNYSLQDILTQNNLPFNKSGLIQPASQIDYWVRIIIPNPGHFAGRYALHLTPDVSNTLYYYDANQQKWLSQKVSFWAPSATQVTEGLAMNITMQPKDTNIVYVKMSVAGLEKYPFSITPVVSVKTQAEIDSNLQIINMAWIATVAVLFFFMLSNLYLYYTFRERSIPYYLLTQLGGIVYVSFYRYALATSTLSYKLFAHGHVFTYTTRNFIQHAGIVLVMFGITNFARFYLNTPKYLPRMDAVVKWALYFYITVSLVLMAINSAGLVVEPYTLLGDNLFLLLFMLFMVSMAITAYRRKLPGAGIFLLAYTFPFYISIGITLFHIFVTTDEATNWFVNLGVVSEAFGFSAALVARIKLVQNNLKAKELEAQQLGFELKEIALRHQLVELENQKINLEVQHEKSKNDLLQQRLEANQREIASTTLYMVQKNELLATLKAEIEELNKLYPNSRHKNLASIESILQSNLYLDDDWSRFKLHFQQVHPDFFEDLLAKHPTLTKNEVRLCAYFHINLSTKEIAALLNIAPASVRRAKTRLYKKIGKAHLLSNDELEEDN